MKIVPPNFGYVEENVFRCGAPEPRHYGFLSSLNLRTCVLLTDTLDEAFMRWMRESGIQVMCPLMSASAPGTRSQGTTTSRGESTRLAQGGHTGSDLTLAEPLGRGAGRAAGLNGVVGNRPGETLGVGAADTVSGVNMWPSQAVGGAADGSQAPSSNAARFLKENNAYASPVTRAEPSTGYMRNGSTVFFMDDTNPDITNTVGRGLMTLPEPAVVSILQVILDARHYPLLITCSKGRYRTGIVCGCLRKLQGWNLVSILEEYRRYAGNKSRAENEEYIELFDTDLVQVETEGGQRPSILYGP